MEYIYIYIEWKFEENNIMFKKYQAECDDKDI